MVFGVVDTPYSWESLCSALVCNVKAKLHNCIWCTYGITAFLTYFSFIIPITTTATASCASSFKCFYFLPFILVMYTLRSYRTFIIWEMCAYQIWDVKSKSKRNSKISHKVHFLLVSFIFGENYQLHTKHNAAFYNNTTAAWHNKAYFRRSIQHWQHEDLKDHSCQSKENTRTRTSSVRNESSCL